MKTRNSTRFICILLFTTVFSFSGTLSAQTPLPAPGLERKQTVRPVQEVRKVDAPEVWRWKGSSPVADSKSQNGIQLVHEMIKEVINNDPQARHGRSGHLQLLDQIESYRAANDISHRRSMNSNINTLDLTRNVLEHIKRAAETGPKTENLNP